MQRIILRIIFSGLIAVVGEEEDGSRSYHKAYVLDESATHQANVFLVEGDCVPPTICSRPPILGGYADLFTLEGGVVQHVEVVGKADSVTPANGRGQKGARVKLPTAASHFPDATWSVPLSEAHSGASLKDCSDPTADCNVEAIFRLPGGEMRTCHLFHSMDWPGIGPQAIRAAFNSCGTNCELQPQALGSALLVEQEWEVDEEGQITLQIVGGKSYTIRPPQTGPKTITLLVMNDGRAHSGPPTAMQAIEDLFNYMFGAAGYGPHDHFSHYATILSGTTTLPMPDPEPPDLLKRVAVKGKMECEHYFETLDLAAAKVTQEILGIYDAHFRSAEAGGANREREQQFEEALVGSDAMFRSERELALWKILSWPHSASECDTATYP